MNYKFDFKKGNMSQHFKFLSIKCEFPQIDYVEL